MKKIFRLFATVLFGLAAGFLFSTCEIGLGPSVDVNAPEIKVIHTPEMSSAKSGTFRISGTCYDDSGVKDVIVSKFYDTAKGVDTAVSLGNAVLDSRTEWHLDVEYNPETRTYSCNGVNLGTLADSKYALEVYCVDKSDRRSTAANRDFDIDNTPPIFMLSSPNSLNMDDPAKYGRQLKLKGSIYDDHGIDYLTVNMYKATKNADGSWTKSDTPVELAKNVFPVNDVSNTSILVAEYNDDTSDTKIEKTNYNKLYDVSGDVGDDTAFYYIDITVKDIAGNINDKTYISDVLLHDSLVSVGKFDGAALKGIWNGSISVDAETKAAVVAALEGTSGSHPYLGNAATPLALSINRNNYPKYDFGGFAYNKETWGNASKSSNIYLKVDMGLDGVYVKPDTLKVKLTRIDVDKNPLTGANAYTWEAGKGTDHENALFRSTNGVNQPTSTITTPVSTDSFTLTLPDTLVNGAYYLLEASGTDNNGQDLWPSNHSGYALQAASSGSAPSVECNDSGKFKKFISTGTYDLPVIITDSEPDSNNVRASGNGVEWKFDRYNRYIESKNSLDRSTADDTQSTWTKISGTTDISRVGDTKEYNTTLKVPPFAAAAGVDNYTLALTVRATNGAGTSTDKVYLIYVDSKAPAVTFSNSEFVSGATISETSSFFTKDLEDSSKGTYNLYGTWEDKNGSGVKTLEYIASDTKISDFTGRTWTAIAEFEDTTRIADSVNWNKGLSVEAGTGKNFYFRATDQTGNVGEVIKIEDLIFDFDAPELSIAYSDSPESTGWYKSGGDLVITVTGTDGFKMKTSEAVTVTKSGSPEGAAFTLGAVELSNEGKTATRKITLKRDGSTDGVWKFKVKATDSAGHNSAEQMIQVNIDATLPVIRDDAGHKAKIDGAVYDVSKWYKKSSPKIEGEIKETASGMATLYYYVATPGNASIAAAANISAIEGSDSISFTNKSGESVAYSITAAGLSDNVGSSANTLYVQPVDNAGNVGAWKSYSIKVDQTSPELSAKWYQIEGAADYSAASGTVIVNSKAVTLYGTVSDDASGIKPLSFFMGDSSTALSLPAGTNLFYSEDVISSSSAIAGATFGTYDSAKASSYKSWKAVIPASAFTSLENGGTAELKISAEDNAENKRDIRPLTFMKDSEAPTVNNVRFMEVVSASESKDAYHAGSKYYVNPAAKTFSISGVARDNIAVQNVSILVQGKNGNADVSGERIELSTTDAGWSFTGLDFSSWTGTEALIIITASDTAGNESLGEADVTELSVVFDRTAPEGKHDLDGKGKDAVFRIGDFWNDAKTQQTGGKYQSGTWANATTLKIRGDFDDTQSGVAMIYYQVVESGSSADLMTAENYASVNTGYFAPLGTPYNMDVDYTDTSTLNKVVKSIRTSFEYTIHGFKEGGNELRLVAVDNAGNAALDTTPVYSLNVDLTPPSAESDSAFAKTILTNGEKAIDITGSALDALSGISAMEFYIGSETYKITPSETTYGTITLNTSAPNSEQNAKWTLHINKDAGATENWLKTADGLGENPAVYAKVTDKALLSTTNIKVATLKIDSTPPSIDLKLPRSGETLNGSNKVSGTVNDGNSPQEISLYTRKSESEDWVLYETKTTAQETNAENHITKVNVADIYTFSFDGMNFNDFVESGATGTAYLKLVAKDEAGNESEKTADYTVDLNSDRPVITLNNLALGGTDSEGHTWTMSETKSVWLKNTKTLYGSITDDDGIDEFYYGPSASGPWTAITTSGSSWTLVVPNEGQNTIYFKVKDSAGTEFVSSFTEPLDYHAPVITDSSITLRDCTVLNIRVDVTSPSVSSIQYKSYDSETHTWTEAGNDYTLKRFGGRYTKIKLFFSASDANGIDNAKVNFNGKTYDVTEDSDLGANHYSCEIDLTEADAQTSGTKQYSGTQYNAEISVKDLAGLETLSSVSFMVDNTPPDISMTVPANTVTSASSVYGNVTEGGCKVYYAVTQLGDPAPAASAMGTDWANNKWLQIKDASMAWTVLFDGTTSTEKTCTQLLKWYLTNETGVGLTPKDAITDGVTFTEITQLDIHIRAEDENGNSNTKKASVSVDPQGDKPQVVISYPATGDTLGGAIMFMGTATDNVSATDVMLLFDMDADGDYDGTDISLLKETGEAVQWAKYTSGTSLKNVDAGVVPETGLSDYTVYGVRVPVTGASWNKTINENGDFNPSDTSTRALKVFAYAVDNEFNHSLINLSSESMAKVSITIDKDSPQFGTAYLRQYDGDTVIAEQEYKDGMAIRGEWYYEVTMYDESNLSSVKLGSTEMLEGSGSGYSVKTEFADQLSSYTDTVAGSTVYGYKLKYKVGKPLSQEVVEEQNYEISIKDCTSPAPKSGTKKINVRIDNKKPVLALRTDEDFKITEYTESEKNTVSNYGRFWTFGSSAKEDPVSDVNQTGVKRIAFYVTRDVDSIHKIYDVMQTKADAPIEYIANNTANDSLPIFDSDDNLYWKKISVVSGAVSTVTISSADANIHKGGLVKLNDVIYRIESVTGTTITVDSTASFASLAGKSAYFALANVVDNATQEGEGSHVNGAGYYTDGNFDDGDMMMESLVAQSSKSIWQANINSKNIGDGKATLHYVVFDEAGNSSYDSVEIFVGNNQPRIAGMIFASDDDTDGNYSDSETVDASNVYPDGMNASQTAKMVDATFPATSTDSAPKSLRIVRNKMRIKPEIVGGNGSLTWAYNLYENSGSLWTNKVDKSSIDNPLISAADETSPLSGRDDEDVQTALIDYFTVQQMKTDGIEDGENRKLELLIKDSTPGGSQIAKLNLILDIALDDKEKPVTKILPFYWKSSADNSLFGESAENGHIELSADLPETFFDSTKTGEFDLDPKVSGKVKIEGVTRDDSQLKALTLKIASNTITANYENGTWTATALTAEGDIPAGGIAFKAERASYVDYLNAGFITEIPDGVEDTSMIPYFTQEYGHVVKWVVYADTETLVGVGLDIGVDASATDRGSPDSSGTYSDSKSSESSSAQTGGNDGSGDRTSHYRIDVVPYITEVTTSLTSKLKSSIKSAYSRTSLGHYIARSDENISIKGFNLGTSSIKPKYGSDALNVDANGTVTLPASKMSTSGPVVLTLGTIKTLNNLNDNDACGSYRTQTTSISEESSYADKAAYAYNRMPNRTSNNLLTDDVVIDVWQFDSDAAKPRSGELREPIMRINPVTGQVGLAFVSGPANISMADENNSYIKWQENYATYSNISFAYDALGKAHATATGLDTNPKDKHAGRFSYFYSKWGQSGLDSTGNYTGTNALRLESISVPYIKGTTTKRTLSNNDIYQMYLNNEIACEEETFYTILANKNLIDSTSNGVLTETRFNSPSLAATVHGTGDAATTSVYLAYYDSIQKQIRFRYNSEVAAVWNADGSSNGNDFADNTGYFWNKTGIQSISGTNGGYQDYMEASTDNFSLIAGVDTQQGETVRNDISSRNQVVKTFVDKESYRRAKNIKADGTLELDGKNGTDRKYTITDSFEITNARLNKIDESLRNRFHEGDLVKALIWTNAYYWIIQDDGLIYISDNDNNVPCGQLTHRVSSIKASDYSYSGYTIDPDFDNNSEYKVYERINSSWSGQSPYFLPIGSASSTVTRTIEVPVYKQYTYNAYDTGYTGYKYVAIDAITGDSASSDVVVAVWYDGDSLRYAYNDNPTSGLDNGSAGGWKGNKVIFSDGGEHCAIKVDSQGHIHIAAYVDGGLRYAYLDSYNSGYTEATDSVLVDSFTITGERISIDAGIVDYTKSDGTTVSVMVPYISYFNGTSRLPTVAKLVIPESGVMNYKAQGTGTEDGDDIFTGNWDVSIVPSPETLTAMYYDKINIGLWKQNGKIVNSNDSGFTGSAKDKTSADNTSATDNGQIYGNGTANPILGYAIESTTGICLETAQMK